MAPGGNDGHQERLCEVPRGAMGGEEAQRAGFGGTEGEERGGTAESWWTTRRRKLNKVVLLSGRETC